MQEEQKLRRPKSDRVERTPSRKESIVINASRLYLMTNAQMVPVEQRQALYAQLKTTTFCFGAFRTPEAIVVALLATEQVMTYLQEQFRVLEFEVA